MNVAFLFRPPNLNTTPDPVYIGHTCIYFYLLIVALHYTRIYPAVELLVVFDAEYVGIHRAVRHFMVLEIQRHISGVEQAKAIE